MKVNAKYISAALLALVPQFFYGAIGAMRDRNVSELTQYTAPATTPAAPQISFMPDGKSYVERSADGKKLVIKDIATGKEGETLFDVTHTRETTLPDFEGFILSPDASKVLVWRESEKVYRRSSTACYYVYEVRSRLLKPLSTEHGRQRDPLFSPDSRMVAFVADGNIYAAKLDYGTEVAVTTDAEAGKVINGATDWTYEEEFGVTSLMTWAPDNLTLCYVRTDESEVPMYTLPIYSSACSPEEQYELYPGVLSYKYPVAGKTNSTVTVHSYDVETRKTKQVELPSGAGYYIPRIEYGPEASMLMVSTLNRDQNRYEVFRANPKSTVTKSVYTDISKAWIEEMVYSTISFGANSFVVASAADGYTRFYEYSYSGSKLAEISQPGVDALEYYGADALGNHYYQAAAPTPMDRTIYRLDRKGVRTAVSPESGASSAVFAPGCTAMLLNHSSVGKVPVYSLNKADGKEIRVLEDNAALASKCAGLVAEKEFFKMRNDNGDELNGYIVKPRNFSASKRYPVIMSQYSGPGSQQVLNRWSLDWEDYFASKGYVVVCVDGRGTGGRGAAFRTAVYKNLGHYETLDQIAAARYAASLPYADASCIGIYGWSFGGYEALMCASADDCPYAAAVAVAPVTDWRFYDTVYTERFMLTPQQNERGYNDSSALGRALHLACPLLMMYGTADDNVHPANTLSYVSRLQNAGILCDMFVFPQMNHSINGCNARAVVWARMLSFFDSKLK
ncbi:MAG: prolyl oligopeptidase family serine peptidase [Bacteroidales bacterium]|nr:prolyl oligopeptidase family serine peptidase [Bacteroidales bacterium]